jgi:KipI family sensor histidine kinase inhibitor
VTVPVHPVGTRALLVDLPDLASAMAWHASLSASPLPGQTDVGAAARTVLVRFGSTAAVEEARGVLASYSPAEAAAATPREVTIDVVYGGEDLDDLAEHLGMTRDALIDWHTSTTWVSAFGGFAPGFSYCVPQDPSRALQVPRRSSPRTAVPSGSVALAGDFSAVYPRTSPGGWQLIGTTTQPFWDATADDPALLGPGDLVRYRPVTEHVTVTGAATTPPVSGTRRPVLRLDEPGLQVLVEDAGRPGFGDLGVTTSGAADRGSAIAANEALGNDRAAAVLENIGGLTLTALVETVVVVTGAVAPVTVDGRDRDRGVPLLLRAGAVLSVGGATAGLRTYVGVRGGVVTESVLGSSATDLLSGLGPAPLEPGDTVYSGPASGSVATVSAAVRTDGVLRVVPGPRDDWFTEGVAALTGTTWTVSGNSNRVGLRLDGPDDHEVTRSHDGELPSEGMIAGSVEIPPSGQPVLFLRDHAVTGGYPVIATVIPEDLDAAAQLPPGAQVTFVLDTDQELS